MKVPLHRSSLCLFGLAIASVGSPSGRSPTLAVDKATSNLVAVVVEVDHTRLETDVLAEVWRASALGPSGGGGSLASYCAGDSEPEIGKGTTVAADWNGYGTKYPGKITKTHQDGSVDVHYEDGMDEKGIEPSDFKVVKSEKEKAAKQPKDDPACELLDDVEDLKTNIKAATGDLQSWLQNAQKKKSNGPAAQTPPPPSGFMRTTVAPAVAGAPAAAASASPGTDPKNAKLEGLKKELADTDAWVAGLEEQITANDVKIHGAPQDDSAGASSIDDLLQQYEAKIARRKSYGHYLEGRLTEQQDYLAKTGVTLDDVKKTVDNIGLDIGKLKEKRDSMLKLGKLDPELEHATSKIISQGKKLAGKLSALMFADKAAKDARAKDAEGETEAAAGGAPAPATAAGRAKKGASAAAKAADDAVFAAAADLAAEVEEVDKGTKGLDEGVVPGGKKWWRYRYEHAFVEAIIVILICVLMLFWERFYHYLRRKAYARSDHPEADAMIPLGNISLAWLEFFAGELMCCTLVFLSVWLLVKFGCLHYLTFILKSSDSMRYPKHGEDYAELAIDLCVVLFWAIFFYFLMILSVVHATSNSLKEWALFENKQRSDEKGGTALKTLHCNTVHETMNLNFASDSEEYGAMRDHFFDYLDSNPELCKEIAAAQPANYESSSLGSNIRMTKGGMHFPFWKYLRISTRGSVDVLFQFGAIAWMQIIVTFAIFMVLHYTLHMGYVRIMSFFIVFLLAQLVLIMMFVRSTRSMVMDGALTTATEDSIHNKYNTEAIIMQMVFFNIFILCYGLARVFFQPWMWQLHFNVCCWLLCCTIIMGFVFCIFVAPVLPVFAVIMALPPFVDDVNKRAMKACAHDGVDAGEFMKW